MTGLQQSLTPDRLQGRVFASIRFFRYGALTVGALVGGLLGEAIGLWQATAVAAAGSTLSLLWLASAGVWTMSAKENAGTVV